MTERVESSKEVRGREYERYQIVYRGIPGVEPEEVLIRRSESGIYLIEEAYADEGDFLIFPLPITLGTGWTIDNPAHGTFNCTYTSIAPLALAERTIEEALLVSCQGSYDDRPFSSQEYFEKNVGSVKAIWNVENETIEFTLEDCE